MTAQVCDLKSGVDRVDKAMRRAESQDRKPLPETLTFYHSSPVENIESILKYGLTLAKSGDVNVKLAIIENAKCAKYRKKLAHDRLLEAYKDNRYGEHICLSGNREYSIQNGNACKEWQYWLDGKGYHGKVAVFKVTLPWRMLEVLTVPDWRSILERFEKLWQGGYFDEHEREIREHASEIADPKRREDWLKELENHPIGGYDHWIVTHVPPEYIESYEIVEQKVRY